MWFVADGRASEESVERSELYGVEWGRVPRSGIGVCSVGFLEYHKRCPIEWMASVTLLELENPMWARYQEEPTT
eukprot:3934679-Rhodomonas_salina.1